jgi:dethiobiotin synthetase
MPQKYFVAGIDTNAGKTLVSAILVEALQADYWKPVQAGGLDDSDTMMVSSLISNSQSTMHPETYRLTEPMSPHIAAAKDGVVIDIEKFKLPVTSNNLIIEGAGGLLVPLNDDFLVIGLIKKLNAEVILVSRNYLGSINHTLLSALALEQYHIKVKGIIFNGAPREGTEAAILGRTGYKVLGRIDEEPLLDKAVVLRYAAEFSKALNDD